MTLWHTEPSLKHGWSEVPRSWVMLNYAGKPRQLMRGMRPSYRSSAIDGRHPPTGYNNTAAFSAADHLGISIF